MRLLCVEGEAEYRNNLIEYLSKHSYKVDAAESCAAALKKLDHQHYDLVLCDIKMPEVNGFSVLRALRAKPQPIPTPFVFLTTHDDSEGRVRAHHWGCDAYLTKPIDFAVLDATLKSHIERRRNVQYTYDAAQESFRSHVIAAIDDALREPIAQMALLTHYVLNEWDALNSDQAKLYMQQLQETLHDQSNTLEMVMSTLLLQENNNRSSKESSTALALMQTAARYVFENNFKKHVEFSGVKNAEQSLVQGDTKLFVRALEGLLAVAKPIVGELPAIDYHQEARHHYFTVADNKHMLIALEDEFYVVNERTDLTSLSQATRERLIPLLYAAEVARLHKGELALQLAASGALAIRLSLPMHKVS